MKAFAFAMFAGLITSPAWAAEGEQSPAPVAVEAAPAPAAAEPSSAPAAVDPTPTRAAAEPAPAPAAPIAAEARKPKALEKAHAAGKPDAKDDGKKKPETAQKPTLTKQAYARLLAAEIRRHTPKSSEDRTGSIHVAFTVGASGRVVSQKVQNSSNPALGPVVGRILASVHTPPPPGGSFSAVQEFNFR